MKKTITFKELIAASFALAILAIFAFADPPAGTYSQFNGAGAGVVSSGTTVTLGRLGTLSTYQLTLNSGTAAYVANVVLSDTGIHPGDNYFIPASYPATPAGNLVTLRVFDSGTAGALLHSSTSTGVAGSTVLRFVNITGTAWSYNPEGALLARNLGAGVQAALGGPNAAAALGGTAAVISQPRANYVEIGTSITAMYQPATPYPAGVGAWLCSGSVGKAFAGWTDYNEGYLGSTLYQWLGSYYATYAHPLSPAVTGSSARIRIELGANDFNQESFNIAVWSGSLDALYTKAHNDGYAITAVTITPRSDALTDWQERNRQAANYYIRHDTVLNSGSGDNIEDRDALFWPAYTSDSTISWDGIHPTALCAQLEARWLNNQYSGLPNAPLAPAEAATTMCVGLGGQYWATLYAGQMYLTSGSNQVPGAAVSAAISLIAYDYSLGIFQNEIAQDYLDNNGSLTQPLLYGALMPAVAQAIYGSGSPAVSNAPSGITSTGTYGAYFGSGGGLAYQLPAALSGTTAFTIEYLTSVPAAPAANGPGNPAFAIFDGQNNGCMIDYANSSNYQTPEAFFQNSTGGQAAVAVSGTLPLGHMARCQLTYDGTNKAYYRLTDLQGNLDQTTTATVGTVTPFNSGNYIGVRWRQDTGAAVYASYSGGWAVTTGSMPLSAANAKIAYWRARFNPVVTLPAEVSGTSAIGLTGAAATILSYTAAPGTYELFFEININSNPDNVQIGPLATWVDENGVTEQAGFTASVSSWYDMTQNATDSGPGVQDSFEPLIIRSGTGSIGIGISTSATNTVNYNITAVIEQLSQ
jgi:hypothetical protein